MTWQLKHFNLLTVSEISWLSKNSIHNALSSKARQILTPYFFLLKVKFCVRNANNFPHRKHIEKIQPLVRTVFTSSIIIMTYLKHIKLLVNNRRGREWRLAVFDILQNRFNSRPGIFKVRGGLNKVKKKMMTWNEFESFFKLVFKSPTGRSEEKHLM